MLITVFVRVARVKLVLALFLEDFHVLHPVVVQGGNHHFWGELDQIPVGDDVLQAFVLETQAGIPGPLLAAFHDFLGMLID